MRASLRAALELVAGAWRVGMLDGRWLPDLAVDLMLAGVEPPSLVELAGLDLGPFDPRDAGDLLVAAFDELDLPMPDRDQAFVTATAFVAWALHTGNVPPRDAVRWAYRSCVQWDPPPGPPELFRLRDLDDDYSLAERGISVRSIEDVDDDVRVLAARLVADATSDANRWTSEPWAAHVMDLVVLVV
ncbi:MAG TPA: hypothetical protein VGO78_14240 [Acidimicrobiales bacterium]|nr:hypothetical protein [Acidimicrobiales bacterium]